ncbi:MAG TPA: FAD-dependent oxidoreductase [Pseudonocardiaceae bacterium]|nr:FAD-dependent oxidoreductase [Pseudonocardiaceae bacterium]
MAKDRPTHGAVIGGGLAGMLAARALRGHLDRVTVIDRDELLPGPAPRKGIPQAHHAHLLWSSGAHQIEALLPGITSLLLAAGARCIGLHQDTVFMSPYGWQRRFPGNQFCLTVSRPLLDWTVRDQVLADRRITVLPRTELCELFGDDTRLTGLRVRDLATGATAGLDADLVVDASGRGSRLRQWLRPLGVAEPDEEVVDSGLAYSTRVYRAPGRAAASFPMVNVSCNHRTSKLGRGGLILPVEDGQWIVTLSGTRGDEPPTDEAGFTTFAEGLRHPVIGQILSTAEPVTETRGSRSSANRRLHYECIERWPGNLVVLGDAFAAFNPVYGHGMSSAALSAAALDRTLRDHLGTPGLARAAMRGIAEVIDAPWILAAARDVFYPGCRVKTKDPRITDELSARQRFSELVGTAALTDPFVSAALIEVSALAAPAAILKSPAVLDALERADGRAPLDGPPVSADEWALLLR